MSSDTRRHRPLVHHVGTVLVAMMVVAIVATATGILGDALGRETESVEFVRGIGILVLLATPLAALVRIAVHGAARRKRMLVVYPLATLVLVMVGMALAR